MAKKEAPAKLTGGAGFLYEDRIAARLLLDMLGRTNSLGDGFGRVVCLDWQARDAGWHADDLAVLCDARGTERAAGLSIKSDRQVTSSGFPSHFVTAAWEHWRGDNGARTLQRGKDAIVLVVGQLAAGVLETWEKTLREALETTPERMVARLSPPRSTGERSLSSKLQRTLFASLRCPVALASSGTPGDPEVARLLAHVRLLSFDFESPSSRDERRAIGDAQRLLVSGDSDQARRLWQRLVGFAAEQRTTGGAAGLTKILATLRGDFTLLDHPDFRADWARLDERSLARMADVRDTIGGLAPLSREPEATEISGRLDALGVCLIAGESGCGKSALAKRCAQDKHDHVYWVAPEDFDYVDEVSVRGSLGLTNGLRETLVTTPGQCLVVFDGIERFSRRGLLLAGQVIRGIRSDPAGSHVHFLLTVQAETSGRAIRTLAEAGVQAGEPYQLGRLTLDQVRDMLGPVPALRWTSFRPELCDLLTNLKVLDLVVQAACTPAGLNLATTANLSSLIDVLWERWIEGGECDFATSGLLMQLGVLEADALSAGVPRTRLGFGEQQALQGLVNGALVRIRSERVLFTHDLLGDWARLRVLVGQDPTAAAADRDRAASPRWHRAVRLYGQRLLEQEGVEAWREALGRADDGSATGTVLRDLLLEGIFLTGSAGTLLEAAWPTLIADDGALLDRFLIVATIPDPRLEESLGAEAERLAHLFRIPYVLFWGPVLSVLHARQADIARLARSLAARVAGLWLRTMPAGWDDGRPFPGRREAAAIVLAVARECQTRREEGGYHDRDEERHAYEAALLAARDRPDEVAQLCLELAQRRDLDAAVAERVRRANARAAEDTHRRRKEDPQRAARIEQLCRPVLRTGAIRPPWPNGPRKRVCEAFQSACLESGSFVCLVRSRPEVAEEVLLAVCIEEPKHENPFGYSHQDDCGVEHWHEGYPPLYDRGPFLSFLRDRPEEAIDFTLRLINFATHRFTETETLRQLRRGTGDREGTTPGLDVVIDGGTRRWAGDPRVFRWHHDWPHESRIVTCSLMALEYWLYERIGENGDVTPVLKRLLEGSESLAFAGLLVDVGKRYPLFFTGVLRPVLCCWELYDLDLQVVIQNTGKSTGLLPWRRRPASDTQRRAREWFGMPHRQTLLRDIAQSLLVQRPEMEDFFAEVRSTWSSQLRDGEPSSLRLLIERLNPENYAERDMGDGRREVSFQWPEEIRRRLEAQEPAGQQGMRLMLFPWQCRERLDRGNGLSAEELPAFWDELCRFGEDVAAEEDSDNPMPRSIDAVCGGVAILVRLHHEWLAVDPERLRWCREALEGTLTNPPRIGGLACESGLGNRNWDAFAAEAGVALLSLNRSDALARRLVARGVLAFRYATTALCVARAFEVRKRLGDDVWRIVHLAVRWAGLRSLLTRAQSLRLDIAGLLERGDALAVSFVREQLPAEIPPLAEENRIALEELAALAPRLSEDERSAVRLLRRRQHADDPGLDLSVLAAGLGWLDSRSAESPDERLSWLAVIRELVSICLATLPPVADPACDEIDGLPTDFDRWVFRVVARTVWTLGPVEDAVALWRPFLDLAQPAHQWVEQFFWHWFPDQAEEAGDREMFFATWAAMIRYALVHPGWTPASGSRHDLGRMVSELLGFHFGINTVAGDVAYGPLFQRFADDFDQASRRWLVLPHVAAGFARFLVQPATSALLLPGLCRLSDAVQNYAQHEWGERGLEDALIELLRACWERRGVEISSDATYRTPFLRLLTALISRGNHAAVSFNAQVIEQIGQQG